MRRIAITKGNCYVNFYLALDYDGVHCERGYNGMSVREAIKDIKDATNTKGKHGFVVVDKRQPVGA